MGRSFTNFAWSLDSIFINYTMEKKGETFIEIPVLGSTGIFIIEVSPINLTVKDPHKQNITAHQ